MELAMGNFNALQAFDRLKDSGISEVQARAIVQTVEQCSSQSLEAVATKGDIVHLEGQINELAVATKGDLLQLETKFSGQINELKVSMNWLQRLFFGSTFLIIVNIAVALLHH